MLLAFLFLSFATGMYGVFYHEDLMTNKDPCPYPGFNQLYTSPITKTADCWPKVHHCGTNDNIKTYLNNQKCVAGGTRYCQFNDCRESICPPGFTVYRALNHGSVKLYVSFTCKYMLDAGCVEKCVWASSIFLRNAPSTVTYDCDQLDWEGWSSGGGGQTVWLRGVRRYYMRPVTGSNYPMYFTDQYCCKTSAILRQSKLVGKGCFRDTQSSNGYLTKCPGLLSYSVTGQQLYGPITNSDTIAYYATNTFYVAYPYAWLNNKKAEYIARVKAVGPAKQNNPQCSYCDPFDSLYGGDGCAEGCTCVQCPYVQSIGAFKCSDQPIGGVKCLCPPPKQCCFDAFISQYGECLASGSFSVNGQSSTPTGTNCVAVGTEVVATCDSIGGSSTISCSDDEVWTGTLPTCSEPADECQNVVVDPHGSTLTNNETEHTGVGPTMTLTCDEGYTSASPEYQCQLTDDAGGEDGVVDTLAEWQDPPALCLENGCDQSLLPSISNGSLVLSDKSISSGIGEAPPSTSVTLVCHKWYIRSGESCVASCIEGQWQNIENLQNCACIARPCQAIFDFAPPHPPWTYDTTPTVNAGKDFYVDGTVATTAAGCQTLTCVRGIWKESGSTVPANIKPCPVYCPAPADPCGAHLEYTKKNNGTAVRFPASVRIHCNPGYSFNSSAGIPSLIKCQSDGTWSHDMGDFLGLCQSGTCCECLSNPTSPGSVTYDAGPPQTAAAEGDTCDLVPDTQATCISECDAGSFWDSQFQCEI